MVLLSSVLTTLAAGAAVVQAYPGEPNLQKRALLKARSEYIKTMPEKDLAGCAIKLKEHGVLESLAQRRESRLRELRKKSDLNVDAPHRQIEKRQAPGMVERFNSMLSGLAPTKQKKPHCLDSHKSQKVAHGIDWELLGSGKSVVLTPEAWNPVTKGEVRKNLREGAQGIPLHLDIQVIDVNTCKPINDAAVNMWHANSAGHATKHNKALKGLQFTNKDGGVQFETVMPGRVKGRTHHINVMADLGANIVKGGSVSKSHKNHIGQIFLDESLLDAVESQTPYSLNPQMRMRNHEDVFLTKGAGGNAEPIMEYTLLGKDIRDGVFGWVNIVVNPSIKVKRQVNPAIPASATTPCTGPACPSKDFDWVKALAEWLNTMMSYQFNPVSPAQAAGTPPPPAPDPLAWLTSMFGGQAAAPAPGAPKPPTPPAQNATTPVFPNTEGAVIGAGILGTLGTLIGGLGGAFSTWTYKSFMEQLTLLMNMTNGSLSNGIFGQTAPTASIPSGVFDGLAGLGLLPPAPSASPTSAVVPGLASATPTATLPPAQTPLSSAQVPGVAPTAKAPGATPAAVPAAALGSTVPKGAPPPVSPSQSGALPQATASA